jgi:hypothetical protein
MKIWVDDVRPAPEGYVWCKTVNETKNCIERCESTVAKAEELAHEEFLKRDYTGRDSFYRMAKRYEIELIDLDHDAGEYASNGGDYIKLLDWLEETGRNYPIRVHSMNPVGRGNMRRIIRKNGWKEVD